MLVNPHTGSGQWWPQGGGRIDPWGGKWSAKAWIGNETEGIGEKFYIAVILVNENDDQYLRNWVEKSEREEHWPSISLPASANIRDRITVTRI